MKTRVILASALLAALVVPAVAFSTTQTQTATVTIESAVGAGAGTNLSITGANPSVKANGTDMTDRNSATAVASFKGYSNKAGWSATGIINAPSGGVAGKLRGGDIVANLTNSMRVSTGTTCSSATYTNNDLNTPKTIVGSGAKNTTEAGQDINLCFNQPISWQDGPGSYTASVTYSLTVG